MRRVLSAILITPELPSMQPENRTPITNYQSPVTSHKSPVANHLLRKGDQYNRTPKTDNRAVIKTTVNTPYILFTTYYLLNFRVLRGLRFLVLPLSPNFSLCLAGEQALR